MKRKCQISECKKSATKVLSEGEIFFLLCDYHHDTVKAEMVRVQERIDNMNEEQLEERLRELAEERVLH